MTLHDDDLECLPGKIASSRSGDIRMPEAGEPTAGKLPPAWKAFAQPPNPSGLAGNGAAALVERLQRDDGAARRLHEDSGAPILALMKDLAWTGLPQARGTIKQAWHAIVGIRSHEERVREFIEHILLHPCGTQMPDWVDPRCTVYSARINGVRAWLTVATGHGGQPAIHVAHNAMARMPAFKSIFDALRAKGWTIRYGERTGLNAAERDISIHPAASLGVLKSLARKLSDARHPDLAATLPNIAERVHRFLMLNDPDGVYTLHVSSHVRRHDQGDGFYNAVARMAEAARNPLSGAAAAGMGVDDVIAIMLYRHTIGVRQGRLKTPGNHARAQVGQADAAMALLSRRCTEALAKLPAYHGTVYKAEAADRAGLAILPLRDMPVIGIPMVYGGVLAADGLLHCMQDRAAVEDRHGSVHYLITSRTGKALGRWSTDGDVVFPPETRFMVTGIQRRASGAMDLQDAGIDVCLEEIAIADKLSI